MIESSLLLKVLPEEASLISSNSHCCEDSGEGFLGSLDPSLTGDLRRDHIVRQPSAREKRQFLPPNKSIHAVNCRDSSLDELAWIFPSERVDRCTVNVQIILRNNPWSPVDGSTAPVADSYQ